jgi:hypothetical protein
LPFTYDANRWGSEVRPIAAWSDARWLFVVNPIFDQALAAPGASAGPGRRLRKRRPLSVTSIPGRSVRPCSTHAGVCEAHSGAPCNFQRLRAERVAYRAAFALL